jgi:hypothetical protein
MLRKSLSHVLRVITETLLLKALTTHVQANKLSVSIYSSTANATKMHSSLANTGAACIQHRVLRVC